MNRVEFDKISIKPSEGELPKHVTICIESDTIVIFTNAISDPTTYILHSGQDGSIIVMGSGHANVHRSGTGSGNAVRYGPGSGDAVRHGWGQGNAVRTGDGRGQAFRLGEGQGVAIR